MSRSLRLTRAIVFAVGLCMACGQAVAEPYSGNHRDDPAVRIVSWAILILFSLAAGLLPAMIRCRADLRVSRVAAHTLAFGFIVGLLLYLSPAFGMLSELVSLILHLIL